MTRQVVTDIDGHEWPVTGSWCDDCGMPMSVTLNPATTHPNCEE